MESAIPFSRPLGVSINKQSLFLHLGLSSGIQKFWEAESVAKWPKVGSGEDAKLLECSGRGWKEGGSGSMSSVDKIQGPRPPLFFCNLSCSLRSF